MRSRRGAVLLALAAAALGLPTEAPAQLEIDGLPAEIQPVEPTFPTTDRYLVDAIHGTVRDSVTGLVWLRTGTCDEIPGLDGLGGGSWSQVMQLVELLEDGLCGLADGSRRGDWRLPTRDEWEETIARAVEIGCTFPAGEDPPSLTDVSGLVCFGDGTPPFQIVQFVYWTSTSDDVDPSRAWAVNLVNGVVEAKPKSEPKVLWPVRDER